jgi:hypothetical protein
MRIRATASATTRSNAVGTVELECTAHGLVVGLFGVGSFSEGYAPGALATGTQLVVPWARVKNPRADGDQLYLELDVPSLPHNRLTLTRFATGESVHPRELAKQRRIVQLGALGIGAVTSLVAAAVVPRVSATTTAGLALGAGLVSAIGILTVGFLLDRRLVGSAPSELAVREMFLAELEGYLPTLVRTPTAPLAPSRAKPLPDLAGFLPRTVGAIAVTLTAGIVTALLGGRHLLGSSSSDEARHARAAVFQQEQEEGTPELATREHASTARGVAPLGEPAVDAAGTGAPETEASAPSAANGAPPAPAGGTTLPATDLVATSRCVCERATSPLWNEPIPTLSVLLLEERKIQKKNHVRTSLEVAVVNNGRESLEEITVHVNFYEGQGKARELTKQKPLYFEGPLAPGQAIKWHTEQRGTEWAIEPPDLGEISPDGEGTAPAAAFRELLEAKNRPVRLHAARMLAFLGDPEAQKATLQLKDALRSAEAPYLRRLLDALAEIRVCNLSVSGSGAERRVEACVFNATDADRDQLGVQLIALDRPLTASRPLEQPPEILGDKKWPLPAALPAQSGVTVRVPIDLESIKATNAGAFEMSANRFDLLD